MPFEIFVTLVSITIVIPLLAYVFRTQFPPSVVLALGGAIWLLMFFSIDNLVMGYEAPLLMNVTNSQNNNSESSLTIENTYIPSSVNVTSTGTNTVMDQQNGSSALTIRSGGNTIRAVKVSSTSSLLQGEPINQVIMSLSKTGSPTGNATIGLFDGSSSGNVMVTCATLDVSTLTTSQADYTFNCPTNMIATFGGNDRIGIKYTGGDASNLVNWYNQASNAFDSTNTVRTAFTSGTWTDVTTDDHHVQLKYVTNKTYMLDSNTNTYWQNNVSAESPLCISANIGAVRTVNEFSINHKRTDSIPNLIDFYTSPDANSWTFRQSLALTHLQGLQRYTLNDNQSYQYFRLCVNSWGSNQFFWRIAELSFDQVITSTASDSSTVQSYVYTGNATEAQPILFEMKNPNTGEPSFFSIMFIVSGLMFMMIGALVEVKGRNE